MYLILSYRALCCVNSKLFGISEKSVTKVMTKIPYIEKVKIETIYICIFIGREGTA